uniref:Uncharacterized protein n=1 Tax=Siphoviridae sp. ctxzZ3 TaxID=2826523 RepID=A0A8S5NEZ4_9CAUD|nr:MAG TPA: hypothetical protein [Siphoviridae sp. ctxzZ3]
MTAKDVLGGMKKPKVVHQYKLDTGCSKLVVKA